MSWLGWVWNRPNLCITAFTWKRSAAEDGQCTLGMSKGAKENAQDQIASRGRDSLTSEQLPTDTQVLSTVRRED